MARTELPSGTVTFLFTDIEGSTRLLHALGTDAYANALAEHRRVLREAFARHGGVEVDTQGDALFVAFPTAPGALTAAADATQAHAHGPIRVRIGIHTGTPRLGSEGYIGDDVHKGARIAAAGHGGQVLVSAATAALVDATQLHDLGVHRLKDLTAPERIYQLGDEHHPPLKTLHQNNLPVPATPFLGRGAELHELNALLARDDVRLVTLTGPGGTGKTRLALAAAGAAADHFPGGVWWVPLDSLRDPALVLESAAKALGAKGDLAARIGDTRLLILLDNFEHLVAAAGGMAALLSACPNLTLLVTSREPLRLTGEHEYAVDPLAPAEAVELFFTRAVAAKRNFTANGEVARICARLDYLPLAIELAAARIKVLTPTALLDRLQQRLPLLAGGARDAPERQRTLRSTIEWSHDLLTPDEQALFSRLAVFRGGWTLDAAESVVEADLDTLLSLVDKSLVRVRPDSYRFWMLETIGEFAVERLDGSGKGDDLRRRHADFFLALAENAAGMIGPEHPDANAWTARLQTDHDNLRAALEWLTDRGDGQSAQQLGGALWKFWYTTGFIGEGWRRLEAALALPSERTAIRARALNGGTAMALERGENAISRRFGEEALAINRELDDPFGIAHAQFLLANAAANDCDWTTARPLLEHCREKFHELGSEYYRMLSTRVLAWVCAELKDSATADALDRENLELARAMGNKRIEGMTLGALAYRAIDDRRFADALPLIRGSYWIKRQEGDRMAVAADLFTMARLLAGMNRPHEAARALGRSTAVYEEIGAAIPSYEIRERDAAIARIRESVNNADCDRALAAGRSMTDDEIVALLDKAVPDKMS